MAMERTYSQARANLAALCTAVTTDVDIVIIHRRGAEDVALISAAELAGLQETAHLLRSPKNAARLQHALDEAKAHTESPRSLDQLRQAVGIDPPADDAVRASTPQPAH
ncbi:MAG: type II toxin-antitoxin system prevent-host-death family antitoxin [Chloroflexota bacterium]|nr:type II toxin-antitoxin system prevent-host-death family antitoxin [Chloroflexota bacterium]